MAVLLQQTVSSPQQWSIFRGSCFLLWLDRSKQSVTLFFQQSFLLIKHLTVKPYEEWNL